MQKTIGEKLILLRGERTQEEVANSVGIARTTLAMYEQDRRIPRDQIKIRLASYYRTPIQDIFFDE
ncbi:helix-turn-helix transcriptional regulator [Proteiniclasticum sp. C24MP]|uniref:helix-turn-helix transcriptional regulator n=1 Tax=Proteiniclasticum sp. C24MP TaxID=3374101 RepID=UPI0037542B7E